MTAYYNENDGFAAAWLNELIQEKLICDGYVDQRSIEEVGAKDLEGFDQHHFFAGIGGWSYTLRLSGWPDTESVWTGSCPCQPLSSAGQRKGHADKRHLWPAFYDLIAECKPSVVFGEQVASKDGREWFAGVRADLEALGYACGAADLCSAGIGAPHIRQRLYWVADAQRAEWRPIDRSCRDEGPNGDAQREESTNRHGSGGEDGSTGGFGHADSASEYGRPPSGQQSVRDEYGQGIEGLDDTDGIGEGRQGNQEQITATGRINPEGLGNSASPRSQEQRREYRPRGERCSGLVGFAIQDGVPRWNGPTVAVECSDGWRRVSAQSDAFPLAHGVFARMGKLRGAGNAICPQVAQAFIKAYLETKQRE